MRELEKLLHSDVSEDRHYRNELKYVCSEGELQLILARIRHICPSDSHASATGTYSIRSIYFDDAQNRCFLDTSCLRDAFHIAKFFLIHRLFPNSILHSKQDFFAH